MSFRPLTLVAGALLAFGLCSCWPCCGSEAPAATATADQPGSAAMAAPAMKTKSADGCCAEKAAAATKECPYSEAKECTDKAEKKECCEKKTVSEKQP